MDLWWSSLGTPHQIYWGIALLTSALLAIQVLLLMLGFDGDADIDIDTDLSIEHDVGGGILSLRTVTAFFTGFGWGGVIALDKGLSTAAATAIATASGALLMAAVLLLMRGLYALRHSGTLDYKNAIGAIGNVYLPIPASMEGPGQVEVLVQGRLAVVQAFTRSARGIPNRARVKVVDLVDPRTLLVEPLDLSTQSSTQSPPEAGLAH